MSFHDMSSQKAIKPLGLREIVKDPFSVIPMPAQADCVMSETLQKLCPGHRDPWQRRTVTLTKDWIGISTVGEKLVAELVPLHEVVSVEIVSEQERLADLPILVPEATPKATPRTPKGGSLGRTSSTRLLGRAMSIMKKEGPEHSNIFQMKTLDTGRNLGRTFWFNCDKTAVEDWVEPLQEHVADAKKRYKHLGKSPLELLRDWANQAFNSTVFQVLFGVLIACNFIVNVGEAQVSHNATQQAKDVFKALDIFFTTAFAVELCLNLAVHEINTWFYDGWNVFDLIIVIFSILSLSFEGIPVVSNLRLLRVFRTVRLFKKLTSLRIIFNSILGSVIPVLNSVFILVIVTAMYAIIAVRLYGGRFEKTEEDFFQDFEHSIFTMYQVATGDSWASGVARPLFQYIDDDGKEKDDYSVMAFFVSYTILSAMILLNVVVAVLLDNFTRCVAQEEKIQRQDRAAAKKVVLEKANKSLDPLMKDLSKFENNAHLTEMIQLLFDAIDINQNQSLSFEELRAGLKSLQTENPILLSNDDFDSITQMGNLISQDGVTAHNFRSIMRTQLEKYTSRVLSEAMHEFDPGSESYAELMALKLILTMRDPEWQSDFHEGRLPSGSRNPGTPLRRALSPRDQNTLSPQEPGNLGSLAPGALALFPPMPNLTLPPAGNHSPQPPGFRGSRRGSARSGHSTPKTQPRPFMEANDGGLGVERVTGVSLVLGVPGMPGAPGGSGVQRDAKGQNGGWNLMEALGAGGAKVLRGQGAEDPGVPGVPGGPNPLSETHMSGISQGRTPPAPRTSPFPGALPPRYPVKKSPVVATTSGAPMQIYDGQADRNHNGNGYGAAPLPYGANEDSRVEDGHIVTPTGRFPLVTF